MTSSIPKTVVITGASTGIGRACARHLDSLGWQVFAGVRTERDAAALRHLASARLTPLHIDVTATETIAAAAQTVAQQVSQLHGLVNNAGIGVGGPLEFLPLTELRRQMEINVIGQMAVTQAFLPLLRAGTGRIINMSSISGRMAAPFVGPYSASKFALEALTDALRAELHPWGIEVISIQPGAIATPIWEKTLSGSQNLADNLPPQAHHLYHKELAAALITLNKTGQRGIPPQKVAEVVAKALTTRHPKTRYLVGLDAKVGAWLAFWLPDRWRDWLILNLGRRAR